MMRLLVCGSREWEDRATVRREIEGRRPSAIIHGACRGADLIAFREALLWANGEARVTLDVCPFPVDTSIDGAWPGAGPARNARMLRDGKPTHGLAFGPLWKRERVAGKRTRDGWKRTGTGRTVAMMLAKRLPVRWVPAPGADAVDLHRMPGPPAEG